MNIICTIWIKLLGGGRNPSDFIPSLTQKDIFSNLEDVLEYLVLPFIIIISGSERWEGFQLSLEGQKWSQPAQGHGKSGKTAVAECQVSDLY